ncbi:TPA: formate dehydrogenase accessory sulfurtransferase FdhD [Candidatus Poribacteria bacterium]|nr:formate dehydrogenase accessory sulfurtransferase FdhD [Candidatus Poribacteria bacterium]
MSNYRETTENRTIIRIDSDGRKEENDLIIREHALTITLSDGKFVKDRRYVTIFCSPSDIEQLGVGFLLSDDIISSIEDIYDMSISDDGSEIKFLLSSNANLAETLMSKRDITSGCSRNLNPYEFLQNLKIDKLSSNIKVKAETIIQLSNQFQSISSLYKSTGGTHASALCDPDGILIFKEDIGRHNAIDKIFGECLLKGIKVEDKMILTSGRISSEILLKVAKRYIPIIISRSAPTSMAIEFADQAGITIVGFARGRRMNVYSHEYRIE